MVRIPALGAHVEGEATRFGAYVTAVEAPAVRILAPDGSAVATHPLEPVGGGYHEALVDGVGDGARYKLVLGDREVPDPFARWLPEGVHGPGVVLGPSRYAWRHGLGVERPMRAQVIYELHVGTFTREGTYRAASARLGDLAALGVTTVELMPIASFAGRRGWGYDGVAHFAPFAPYGEPDDLRAFVDEAHGHGLGVILDVVYNHFGPSGNYLGAFSRDWFRDDVMTPWGDALDFRHAPMRRLVLDNVSYWLDEFRFDGLRLDAIATIVDPSPLHILRELAARVSARRPRPVVIAEDDRNDPASLLELGVDAVWADDWHHQVHVTLTGERDGYYGAYTPGIGGVARAIEQGWLYEGATFLPWGRPRGAPASGIEAAAFVYALQNHDQIGNRALGERLHALVGTEAFIGMSALFLLLPMTPLLFMGQEWAASTPFLYFTDHDADLGRAVTEGRRAEFASFDAFSDPSRRERIPDPQALETFERSKLVWGERDSGMHARVLETYRRLLQLRRSDTVIGTADRDGLRAWAEESVLLVLLEAAAGRRLIAVNVGAAPAPRPAACAGAPELFSTQPETVEEALAPWEATLFDVSQS